MHFYVTLVARTAVLANPRPRKNRRPFEYKTHVYSYRDHYWTKNFCPELSLHMYV
jgi:hypothetical protein